MASTNIKKKLFKVFTIRLAQITILFLILKYIQVGLHPL